MENSSKVIGTSCSPTSRHRWREVGGAAVTLLAIYLILKGFGLLPSSFGVGPGTTVGTALVLGLVAAFSSCMAVTGSLVLAASSRYSQAHPELTRAQKLKPQLYFNLGRLVGYTGFGALVGWLGSTITLSLAVSGGVTVVISVLMVVTGLNMLGVWPWLQHFQPRPPKWLSARVYRLRGSQAWGVFIGGSLTFFLPCGFTQALQLYVLSQGSAGQGALLLGAFALGTLPGLLSVGAVASLASGRWQRYATAGAAVLVVALGIFNFRAGWVSAGWPSPTWPSPSSGGQGAAASVEDGVQVAEMAVVGYQYQPSRFVVKAGVPVEWRINGDQAAGCARVLVARSIGVQKLLASGQTNVIRFTPTQPGIIPFSCSMGMTTPGAQFLVLAS